MLQYQLINQSAHIVQFYHNLNLSRLLQCTAILLCDHT